MTEKTGKRNLCYNRRHREYDRKDKMMDIDNLEHDDEGNMLALIETKFGRVGMVDLNELEFDVLCKLSSLANDKIPVFCLVYYPMDKNNRLVDAEQPFEDMTHIQFFGMGVNLEGKRYLPKPTKLTELEWVAILARIHGHDVSEPNKYCKTWVEVRTPMVIPRS